MKDRPIAWVFLAFALGFILPVCSCVGTGIVTLGTLSRLSQQPTASTPSLGDAVAVLELNGSITSTPPDYFTTQGITPGRVRDLLEQAANNSAVKAVVVHVNSPGGSVVASDEIYHAFQAFEKPVIVAMSDIAASGGYYIACGGDHVIAHPDTLTGSIGVISQFLNADELLDKVGVDAVVIASGPRKDIGSPYREMTEEEKALWQTIIDQVYEDFVDVVAEARDLPPEEVREIADGSIYTGQQALELGLVDEVGTREDAIARAAESGGIEGDPDVIELRPRPSFLDMIYGIQARSMMPTLEEILGRTGAPSLQYRLPRP
jgi:protease-4